MTGAGGGHLTWIIDLFKLGGNGNLRLYLIKCFLDAISKGQLLNRVSYRADNLRFMLFLFALPNYGGFYYKFACV